MKSNCLEKWPRKEHRIRVWHMERWHECERIVCFVCLESSLSSILFDGANQAKRYMENKRKTHDKQSMVMVTLLCGQDLSELFFFSVYVTDQACHVIEINRTNDLDLFFSKKRWGSDRASQSGCNMPQCGLYSHPFRTCHCVQVFSNNHEFDQSWFLLQCASILSKCSRET